MSFQAYLDNIQMKTGKTPNDFKKLAEKKGLLKEGIKAGEIVAWLKKDFQLGHGHAMAIYTVFKGTKEKKVDEIDAIQKHFTGIKSVWRPVFDDLIKKINKYGNDTSVVPGNSYLSILRGENKVAIVQVTKDRLDIGIKRKGAAVTERFESAGTWNAMVTHRVRIHDKKQIDKELLDWLSFAYHAAGIKSH
ncbi:MAG TPA: DUF4287 domain-containing protein [Flavitalea sp.]|nr:DUF4287 domain-containing protein [Flavitalea sp.]